MASRFSFSVPGRRGPSDPWFRVGTVDVTTTVLVTALCVLSLFVYAFEGDRHPVLEKLALIPDDVTSGQVWRLFTWPLANFPDGGRLLWTVITIAIFWLFGREIERLMGRVRFTVFLLLLTVIPGIVGTLIDTVQFGIRPIEFGVFLVFVAEYPFARFFFNIPGWVVGAVLLVIEILQILADPDSERHLIFLFVTLAVAGITAKSMGLLSSLPWMPAVPLGRFGGGGSSRRSRPKRPRAAGGGSRSPGRRSGGDVVEGPWTAPRSGPTGSAPLPPPPVSAAEAAADQAELDALLDKISDLGMDGLSSAEKQRLNELSKRMRNRR
ncbi:rhomboid family intramembrane serine protease [Desertimonas flava]|jgi:hypothetical protein|uniref:rhomboid family intramembrane serine protease n=1 Tax=Desertimonas flava TaxID=2064846 RepID=UPI000E347B41|nr:rhomboid family intramembrane serine protease [Desertimonas flava]